MKTYFDQSGNLMTLSDYLTLRPLIFGIKDRLTDIDSGSVTVVPRDSALGAGGLSLIAEAADDPAISRVYVAVRDLDTFENVQNLLEPKFEHLEVRIIPVQIDSHEFISGLAKSSLLFLNNQYDIPNYRALSSRNKRDVVRIHHGILTKAYGNLTAENQARQRRRRRKNIPYPNRQKYISNIHIDVQSVESDVEIFYRATAEGRSPTVFCKYGYPRFDRLKKLMAGTHKPLIPESSADQLSGDRNRVLYAPTHKDDTYKTTLFPFSEFDLDELREFLREMNIELYVRMHSSEDEEEFYSRIVDGETIFRAGGEFAPSPIEILPAFDVLVTDYSSIYMDFLPTDRPIIFVQDDHEQFLSNRGLAFDYDNYFPGRKVKTFEIFLDHLSDCVENSDDGHAEDRTFVKRTFLPERNKTFLNHVVKNHLK